MARTRTTIDFTLPNVGPGPDPLALSDLVAGHDFVVVYLQRDHLCTNCRKQVQQVADRYGEFRERNAEVVSVVPEPREKVQTWQDSYDLPYPLCADPDTRVSAAYDQPVKYGVLGNLSDLLGRMPKAVLLDCRDDDPTVAYTHEGSSTWDRPELDELIGEVDSLLEE